jgi:hypothetical protein
MIFFVNIFLPGILHFELKLRSTQLLDFLHRLASQLTKSGEV